MRDDTIHSIEPLDDTTDERFRNSNPKDWLDNQDIMQMMHVSSSTLQDMRSKGRIPYTKFGHKVVYFRDDIMKILATNYKQVKTHGDNDK